MDRPDAADIWASGNAYEPYVGRWSRAVARELLAWLNLPPGSRWLDVGCGTGALSSVILELSDPVELVGIDQSEGYVRYARERIPDERARFEVGDARNLPVESAAFGLPVSPAVRVLDPAKKPVAKGEPRQLHDDATLVVTPAADGTYGIEVRDLYGAASDRHRYLVRVVPAEPGFALTTAGDRLTLVPGKPLDVAVTVAKQNGFTGDVALTVEGLPPGVTTLVGIVSCSLPPWGGGLGWGVRPTGEG